MTNGIRYGWYELTNRNKPVVDVVTGIIKKWFNTVSVCRACAACGKVPLVAL